MQATEKTAAGVQAKLGN